MNPLAKHVMAVQLAEEIGKDLQMYSDEVTEELRKSTRKAMKKLVDETKETAPLGKRKKHYKDQISSRSLESSKLREVQQWYVKEPDYRLSHLLNSGHEIWNADKDYPGTKFIEKAEEEVMKEHQEEVERIINGH